MGKNIWSIETLCLFLILFGVSADAHAVYHRFWVGFKKDGLSLAEFELGLQKIFFPKTIDAIKPYGLIAYQPVIIPRSPANPQSIPDEIALVTYADEKSHARFKESPDGKSYVDLHWNYFKQDASKSAVPEVYAGTVEVDHSYDLMPNFQAWRKHSTSVIIYRYDDLSEVKIRIEAMKRNEKILGYVLLIKNGYVVEYVAARAKTRGLQPKAKALYCSDLRAISKDEIGPETLEANFRF